uniref:Prothymosin alpha n=1 Tax=Cercocebus atys TaxID=9531 RepID=A0A2K5NQ54_CERAT
MSDAAVDTSSEITTKDLKEKKEVVEEAENGRDAPANGNAKMGALLVVRSSRPVWPT